MKGQDVLFSRKSDEWETPPELFAELNKEFRFDLDPCATASNAKCARYFTLEDDGLAQNWGGVASSVTRRIVILNHGLRKQQKKPSAAPLWSCSYLPGLIQDGFTTIYTIKQKSALSGGGYGLAGQKRRRPSRRWSLYSGGVNNV